MSSRAGGLEIFDPKKISNMMITWKEPLPDRIFCSSTVKKQALVTTVTTKILSNNIIKSNLMLSS